MHKQFCFLILMTMPLAAMDQSIHSSVQQWMRNALHDCKTFIQNDMQRRVSKMIHAEQGSETLSIVQSASQRLFHAIEQAGLHGELEMHSDHGEIRIYKDESKSKQIGVLLVVT